MNKERLYPRVYSGSGAVAARKDVQERLHLHMSAYWKTRAFSFFVAECTGGLIGEK